MWRVVDSIFRVSNICTVANITACENLQVQTLPWNVCSQFLHLLHAELLQFAYWLKSMAPRSIPCASLYKGGMSENYRHPQHVAQTKPFDFILRLNNRTWPCSASMDFPCCRPWPACLGCFNRGNTQALHSTILVVSRKAQEEISTCKYSSQE